ncbi:hypothetical protein DSM109990_02404 [Sulfitobacter dubius]|uniref:Uncharacterized protein n=1 Tax=Sulfitobacter dubius TaxID=218673 RepID=A0ABY3ZN16_9RHOB|nr:hypothetical protein DSM109990_02404 [Sulfitobacter dubius]
MMQRAILGITVTRCCWTIPNLGARLHRQPRGVKRFNSGKPAFSEVISNDLDLSDPKPDTKWAQGPRPNVLRNYLRSDVKPVAGMETFPPAMKQSAAT